MYVAIVGNPINGFTVFGPFENFEEACDWCEGVDESNWVDKIEKPE